MTDAPYGLGTLPTQIRSRMLAGVNGLDVHILEAGFEAPDRPLALLLHGFPDLAYGWRHLMPLLAEAGYHVVAPDQRGYGRTTGWSDAYDTPLQFFGILNLVRDALALVSALGHTQTALVVGHDFGSPVASYCALARPEVFPAVALMSAPFPGAPAFPFGSGDGPTSPAAEAQQKLKTALAALEPSRVLYQHYFGTPNANADLLHPAQGFLPFLRTFFYLKSGDWPGNQPHPISPPSAEAFAELPRYYILERGKTMPENVASYAVPAEETADCPWLTDAELAVYAEEYGRTGFQGALQGYRVLADPALGAELRLFSGRTIDVPSLFIGGERDWATYVSPGALEAMQTKATTQLRGTAFVAGAGHWIQQEKPEELARILLDFARSAANG